VHFFVKFVSRSELTALFSCFHAPYLWPQRGAIQTVSDQVVMASVSDTIEEELRKIEREFSTSHSHRAVAGDAVHSAGTPRHSDGGPSTEELLASISRVLAPTSSSSAAAGTTTTAAASSAAMSASYTATTPSLTAAQRYFSDAGRGAAGVTAVDEALLTGTYGRCCEAAAAVAARSCRMRHTAGYFRPAIPSWLPVRHPLSPTHSRLDITLV
jgi:hypothetical protein